MSSAATKAGRMPGTPIIFDGETYKLRQIPDR